MLEGNLPKLYLGLPNPQLDFSAIATGCGSKSSDLKLTLELPRHSVCFATLELFSAMTMPSDISQIFD